MPRGSPWVKRLNGNKFISEKKLKKVERLKNGIKKRKHDVLSLIKKIRNSFFLMLFQNNLSSKN